MKENEVDKKRINKSDILFVLNLMFCVTTGILFVLNPQTLFQPLFRYIGELLSLVGFIGITIVIWKQLIKKIPIKIRATSVLSFFMPVVILLTIFVSYTVSQRYPSKDEINLDFEWHNLESYEYNADTGEEYLILRRIEPENPETHDSAWTYIRVDTDDYSSAIQDKEKPLTESVTDSRTEIDTNIFPFWEDGMVLQNIADTPDGNRSVISAYKPRDDGYPGSKEVYYLRVGDEYTLIGETLFLHGLAWATDTLLYNLNRPLEIYDTDTRKWVNAFPKDETLHGAFRPKWINEREFLCVLKRQSESYAALINYQTQTIVKLIPLTGEVTAAEWSEKNIGVLWYQPSTAFGAKLYRNSVIA